jgi:hypothetical protein
MYFWNKFSTLWLPDSKMVFCDLHLLLFMLCVRPPHILPTLVCITDGIWQKWWYRNCIERNWGLLPAGTWVTLQPVPPAPARLSVAHTPGNSLNETSPEVAIQSHLANLFPDSWPSEAMGDVCCFKWLSLEDKFFTLWEIANLFTNTFLDIIQSTSHQAVPFLFLDL